MPECRYRAYKGRYLPGFPLKACGNDGPKDLVSTCFQYSLKNSHEITDQLTLILLHQIQFDLSSIVDSSIPPGAFQRQRHGFKTAFYRLSGRYLSHASKLLTSASKFRKLSI